MTTASSISWWQIITAAHSPSSTENRVEISPGEPTYRCPASCGKSMQPTSTATAFQTSHTPAKTRTSSLFSCPTARGAFCHPPPETSGSFRLQSSSPTSTKTDFSIFSSQTIAPKTTRSFSARPWKFRTRIQGRDVRRGLVCRSRGHQRRLSSRHRLLPALRRLRGLVVGQW